MKWFIKYDNPFSKPVIKYLKIHVLFIFTATGTYNNTRDGEREKNLPDIMSCR